MRRRLGAAVIRPAILASVAAATIAVAMVIALGLFSGANPGAAGANPLKAGGGKANRVPDLRAGCAEHSHHERSNDHSIPHTHALRYLAVPPAPADVRAGRDRHTPSPTHSHDHCEEHD